MKKILTLACCAAVAAVFVLSGCATSPADAGGAVSDRELVEDVYSRLADDEVTQRFSFDVTAENGVVTLRAVIPSDIVRTRALGVTRNTEGVKDVVDMMYRY